MPIITLERLIGHEIESGEADSIGGLVMQHLDRVPHNGDTAEFDDMCIEVLEMEGPRVERVRLRIQSRTRND